MQELDIPSVKILSHEKTDNPKVLKYTYFDTQTGIKDFFYSHQKVNHIPNLPGTLFLTIDDNQQKKFFFSFSRRLQEFYLKEPIKFEKPLEKETIKTKLKKTVTKLAHQQIRKLREKGFSWQEIRDFCGVSEWTIRRWNKEKENKERKKPGGKPKVNGNDLLLLESCANTFSGFTQQWISEHFSRKIGQSISQPTISRLYKKYGITRKTMASHYSELKPLLERIKPFTNTVKSLPSTQLLAEDECAFYLNEAPRRGYGWKGERVISWKPGNFAERYTLMLCIRNVESKGVIHWKLMEKGAKAKDFYDFIEGLPISDENYFLLLDNAKIHHAVGACKKIGLLSIKRLLISRNILPFYLVAYCPQLNPVELIFNILRKYVEENQPRTFEELKLVIEEKILKLQKENMTKYFRHCMDYDFEKNEQ